MDKRRFLLFAVIALVLLMVPMGAQAAWVKVCIDPGHGGSDPGATALGDKESSINLSIGLAARTHFLAQGAAVVMTRTTDKYVSLQGRCDISNNNGCNLFECSHCNAGGGHGTETYCWGSGSSKSFTLRNDVNAEMVAHMGTTNRGNKTANYYVLIHTNAPAILCEVAFIDTTADNNKLSSATYRDKAGDAYLHGTQWLYGRTRGG